MFDAYVRDAARASPRAPAVVTPARTAAYADLDADIDRCAAAFADEGLGPASGVVSVRIEEPYLQVVALCALARLGVISSPAADDAADLRLADAPQPAGGPRTLTLTPAWWRAASSRPATPLPPTLPDPEAVGRVMLSSGTTRAPRRVALSWRRIEVGAHATIRAWGSGRHATWIPVVGLDAMMGFNTLVAAFGLGATLAHGLPFEALPGWIEALPPGVVAITPIQLRNLISHIGADYRAQPHWRFCVGGSLLSPALARQARLALTPDVRIVYGATEAGLSAFGHAADLDALPGVIGHTPAGAISEVVDEDGRPLPPGEPGELRVRGERTVAGYLGDPEATAQRFRNGWFMTGDIARRLPDGRLVLEGRADDRMNLGGRKLMPAAVEEAALATPGVADAAAFAVPGPDGLDAAWLAVVPAPGHDPGALAAPLAAQLARAVDLTDCRFAWTTEIPRNAMGKVDRASLRDAVRAATGAA